MFAKSKARSRTLNGGSRNGATPTMRNHTSACAIQRAREQARATETFRTICEMQDICEIDGAREKTADGRRLSCQYWLKLGSSRGQHGRGANQQAATMHMADASDCYERGHDAQDSVKQIKSTETDTENETQTRTNEPRPPGQKAVFAVC